MKRGITFLILLAIVMVFSMQAHAALNLRGQGTSAYGTYNLIYDTDLDITWYDYTRSPDTWPNQVKWADALSVTFGSNTYTDWRLPTTVDGPYVWGYDGTTSAGYNITSSEMGHLFYTELGNKGWYDKSVNPPSGCSSSSPYCLTKTGDFQNLQSSNYWSGTERADPFTPWGFSPGDAWVFSTSYGGQGNFGKATIGYAVAVRPGDVSVAIAPKPMSMVLFGCLE